MTPDEMIPKSDHLEAVNALRAEYLGRYMAAIREIERLRDRLKEAGAFTLSERWDQQRDEIDRLRAAFRTNMLRMDPTLSHADIDKVIDQ
jgi:hypothetical protein